jgi:hypothetical protein
MWKGAYDDLHRQYMAMMDNRLVFIDTVAERLKEKSDYIEQFKENKELNNHSLRA